MLIASKIEGRSRLATTRADACSLSDQLVLALASVGITDYFGVPGGAIEPLFNTLARQQRQGRVRLTATRGEAGAAFAADGYYRETGRLAVCTATSGPGISNLVTAVMNAHADRIPMLILTPQIALPKQGRGGLQDSSSDGYDLEKMLAECTRYSTTITHPDQLGHKLARAVRLALTAPRGPVHLSIPSDLLVGRPASMALDLSRSLRVAAPVDEHALKALVSALLAAKAPTFYVGDDAGREASRLLALAHALGGNVVASPAGKRWLGHSHRAYRGVLGFSGNSEATEATSKADLVVAVGATFDELSTNAWTTLPKENLYSVDEHALHAHRNSDAVPVIASTTALVDALAARVPLLRENNRPRRPVSAPRLVRSSAEAAVHPSDLMHWLSQELPSDVVVHIDAGNGFSWSTRDLSRSEPDTYRVAMGLSTMCWAIGAVLGAAVASGRRTFCIAGDGSMLMSSLELTVAVDQRLPITYVVLNDSGLGMVRHGQRLAGAEPIAHDISKVRFDRLAKACGARGLRVEHTEDLANIPRSWLSSDQGGPAVIDVSIDRCAVPPMADRVKGLAVRGAR